MFFTQEVKKKVLFFTIILFSFFGASGQVSYDLLIKQETLDDSLILDLYIKNTGDQLALADADFPIVIRGEDQSKLDLSNIVLRDYTSVWSDKQDPNQFEAVKLSNFIDSTFTIQVDTASTFDINLSRVSYEVNSGDSVFIASVGIPILSCLDELEVQWGKLTGERFQWNTSILDVYNNATYVNPVINDLHQLPILESIQDTVICAYDSIIVFAKSEITGYEVSVHGIDEFGASFSISGVDSVGIWVDSALAQTFTVNLSNGFCDTSYTVTVQVNNLETEVSGTEGIICFSDSTLLTSVTTGGDINSSNLYTYQWLANLGSGVVTNVNNNNTYVKPNTTYDNGVNTYNLIVSDDQGCEAYDTVIIRMNRQLLPAITTDTTYICANRTAIFTSVVSVTTGGYPNPNDPNYELNWTDIDGNLKLVATASPTVTIVGLNSSPPYTASSLVLSASDSLGCMAYDTTTVFVEDIVYEPVINYDTICSGITVSLDTLGIVPGKGKYRFAWLGEGIPNNDDTLASTTATPTSLDTTLYYTMILQDEITGCAAFDSVPLRIEPIVANLNLDSIDVCFGDQLVLDASASFGAVTFRSGNPHLYSWSYPNASAVGSNVDQSITLINGLAGSTEKVLLEIADSIGCKAQDSVYVKWSSQVVNNIIEDTIYVCKETLSPGLSNLAFGGTPSYTYEWSRLSGNVNFESNITNTQNVNFSYDLVHASDTSIVVQNVADSLGCTSTDTVVVIGIDFQIQASSTFNVVCKGVSNLLNVDFIKDYAGPFSYNWTPSYALNNTVVKSPDATIFNDETFKVVVNDSKTGCIDSSLVQVNVSTTTAILNNQQDTIIVCAFDSLTLDATSSFGGTQLTSSQPYWYRWNNLSGIGTGFSTVDTTSLQTVKAEGAEGQHTQYTLTVIDAAGCEDKDSIVVFWNTLIDVNIGMDTSFVCTPLKDTLTVTSIIGGKSPYIKDWSLAPSSSSTMLLLDSILSVNDNDESYVYLAVEDQYGCEGKDSIYAIGLDFQVEATIQFDSVCSGLEDSLFVNLKQDFYGGFTYSWTSQNNSITNSDMDTAITFPTVDDKYNVEVVDLKTSCVAIDSIEVKMREVIAVAGPTLMRDTLIVCFDDFSTGVSVNANLSSSGERNLTSPFYASYLWRSNDADVLFSPNTTNISQVTKKSSVAGYSEVFLEITDLIGCQGLDTLVIKWNNEITITTPSSSLPTIPVCVGEDSIAVIASGGTKPYSYAWSLLQLSGGEIAIKGTQSDSLINLAITDYGAQETLEVQVTDALGCEQEVSLMLESYDLSIDLVSDFNTVCPGRPVTVMGSLITPPDSVGNILWSWDNKSSWTDDTLDVFNVSTDLVITTFARDEVTGCMDSSFVSVQAQELVLDISSNPSNGFICFEDSLTMTLNGVSGGSAPYTHVWSDGVNDFSTKSLTVKPLNVGTRSYSINVEDANGCSKTEAVNVTRGNEISVQVGKDTTDCLGESIDIQGTMSGGSGSLTSQWRSFPGLSINSASSLNTSISAFSAGTYQMVLVATDVNTSCSSSDTLVANFTSLPFISMPDTFICENDQIVLKPGGRPYPIGSVFEWERDGIAGLLVPDNQDSLIVTNSDWYELKITAPSPSSCENSTRVFVDQVDLPKVKIDPIEVASCSNDSVDLKAQLLPDTGYFFWDVISPYGNQNNFTDTLELATTYQPSPLDDSIVVIAVHVNICASDTDTVVFNSIQAPIIDLETSNRQISINQTVSFEELSSTNFPERKLEYEWFFETGSPSYITTAGPHEVLYQDIGIWSASLIVEDLVTGCKKDTTVNVVVEYIQNFYVPNVFSPSAQNLNNQTLKVFGMNVENEGFEFIVYNRWGEKVYETKDFVEANTIGWTGVSQSTGLLQQGGVYTYTVEGEYSNGEEFSKTGTVTLIR